MYTTSFKISQQFICGVIFVIFKHKCRDTIDWCTAVILMCICLCQTPTNGQKYTSDCLFVHLSVVYVRRIYP